MPKTGFIKYITKIHIYDQVNVQYCKTSYSLNIKSIWIDTLISRAVDCQASDDPIRSTSRG